MKEFLECQKKKNDLVLIQVLKQVSPVKRQGAKTTLLLIQGLV